MLVLKKSKNIIFSPWDRENIQNDVVHPFGHQSTRSASFNKNDQNAPSHPKVDQGQTRSKSTQNNTFHGFTSNLSFSKNFNNFDQVWPKVDLGWAQKP